VNVLPPPLVLNVTVAIVLTVAERSKFVCAHAPELTEPLQSAAEAASGVNAGVAANAASANAEKNVPIFFIM
jgi:hypothetical protein